MNNIQARSVAESAEASKARDGKDLTGWKREVLNIRQQTLRRWSDQEFEEQPELEAQTPKSFELTKSDGLVQFLRTLKETVYPHFSGSNFSLQPAFPQPDSSGDQDTMAVALAQLKSLIEP